MEKKGPKTARAEEARRAEEAERARRVAREAAERHAEIARQLERMAQVAGETAGQAAHAREAENAARDTEALRVEEAERATLAAGEAAARREETLLRAQRLAARAQQFASRVEASRREMESALREEARALFLARQAREAREKAEARHATVAREGPAGVVALRTAQPDRIVVLPEAPSVAPSVEREGAFAIGEAPRPRGARARIPGFLRRGHPMLTLSVVALLITGVIAGVVARTLFLGDLPSERRPATEVSGTDAGIVVPELSGLIASHARDVLLTANLRLAGIVPVGGEPGLVAGTRPAAGAVVSPGRAVTLMIGVEPERLEQEE